MNFNLYIFGTPTSSNVEIYPKDKFLSLFQEFADDTIDTSKIVVTRREQVVYYTYLRYDVLRISNKEKAFFGITLAFNGVYCTDINKLYELFDTRFEAIVERETILTGSDKGKPAFAVTALCDIDDEIEDIREQINKAFDSHFQLSFQDVDTSFKWGKILDEPRKYSLYEGNNVLTAVLKEHTNIAISKEYEVQKKTLFSSLGIWQWVALLIAIVGLVGWVGYRFLPINTIPPTTPIDTLVVVKTEKRLLSSTTKPQDGKTVGVVLFHPEYVSLYILVVDTLKNWETLLGEEKYSRGVKQVNSMIANTRLEKKKAILNQILQESLDKKKIDHFYFIAEKSHAKDEDIKEYVSVLELKGYEMSYFDKQEVINEKKMPMPIRYVLSQKNIPPF